MNKKSNEFEASVDYSLSALLDATRQLCNTILQEISKGKNSIKLNKIDYHYDNMVNDCSYFLSIVNKISEKGREINKLLNNLTY